MTRHGKLRDLQPRFSPKQRRRGGGTTAAADLWQWISQGNFWMVPKQRFLHFYMIGTVSLVGVRVLASSDPWWSSQTVAQGLLLLHILRRWYECEYVHQWRSTSVMHVAVYALGLVYYALLPFIFCQLQCPAQVVASADVGVLDDGPTTLPKIVRLLLQIGSIILCLYAQHQQARHHVILANLRLCDDNDDNRSAKTNNTPNKPISTYRLPEGGWFHWVACPHYLAEIFLYVGLASLLPHVRRGVVIVAWVVTSLTLNALETQQWYARRIPGYERLQRRAIFPYIL